MANFMLPNNQILTASIHVTDGAGGLEPAPVGDVFTVVSSNPVSLAAVLGTDAAGGLTCHALVCDASAGDALAGDAAVQAGAHCRQEARRPWFSVPLAA